MYVIWSDDSLQISEIHAFESVEKVDEKVYHNFKESGRLKSWDSFWYRVIVCHDAMSSFVYDSL